MRFYVEGQQNWVHKQALHNRAFICGFCATNVSSIVGYKLGNGSDGSNTQIAAIYICPNCGGPNFFSPDQRQHPGVAFGNPVRSVPTALTELYEEARRATSASCFTGAVLLCRKMLMNIAVSQGAEEGLNFVSYVNYLSTKGFIPPNGTQWVDHIRKKGNEATHEISLMSSNDAKELLVFIEMLLKFIYEFPAMIPTSSP